MTLFQCRRFQFFDLEKLDVDIKLKENLKGCEVKCGTSGRGRIIIGDSEGLIHFVTRQFEAKTVAEAHSCGVLQLQQLRQSPFLVSLGEDELASFSIKVWDELSMEVDSSRTKLYLRRSLKLTRPRAPSCFAAHENLTLLVVGFSDGYLQLYRGEYTRDRNMKPKPLLADGDHGEITGLTFKTVNASVILFVSTKFSVFSFDITSKDREGKLQSDKPGCKINCSCYSGLTDDHFIVGRNDAIYCYTHEGKGPCFGFEGEKHFLYCFRGYLLIVAKLSAETYSITIFDCSSKYLGFQSSLISLEPIIMAASEWGSLFLITSDGTLWELKEKDLQTKLSVFYKKNHYDLAIKIAKNNNFDADGMADIFRLYADHLYAKGDLDGAIRQYCKTVGKLEASYVVRKYLDASRVLNLLEYLEVVHKTGNATPDLTTLLLNCLTKLKLNEKIEIYVKDPSCDFLEPETAIKVLRRGGMSKQAYQLAQKHELYGSALQILLEDVRDPCKDDLYNILEKVIQDEHVDNILKRFGHPLVQLVCQTDSKSQEGWKKIVRLLSESPAKRELVELFIAKKDILVPLLENICLHFENHDGPLMNLLLEAYLGQWSKNKDIVVAKEKMLALLSKAPECPSWDWARALFACKMVGFNAGEIIAYERLGLHNDLFAIRYSAAMKTPTLWPQFIETCHKYAKTKPSLWKDAFWLITSTNNGMDQNSSSVCPQQIVEEILNKLLEEKLMEPLPILDRLCQTKLKLGSVRSFLIKVLDRNEIEEDEKQAKRLQDETASIRNHIENIRTKPCVFQGSRCNACMQKLEFPSVHFLCLHSFHQHCFESYAENDRDCPICWSKNKELISSELSEKKSSRAALESDFALKLSTAKYNSFTVLADFFSKGIFSEEREAAPMKRSVEKVYHKDLTTQGPVSVSEAKIRLREGSRAEKLDDRRITSIESFLDEIKQPKQSSKPNPSFNTRSNIAPNVSVTSLPFPRVQSSGSSDQTSMSPKVFGSGAKTISSAIQQNTSKNPFEEEDEAKNPFFEASTTSTQKMPKNPFEDDDDYDPSLNPFEN